MQLLISTNGLKINPENLPKQAINNGYNLYIDNSEKGHKHKLVICDFTLYKLIQLDNFIINDLFIDKDVSFNFCKTYSTNYIKDYLHDIDYGTDYFKLLKDSHLNLNNKMYQFNGYSRFENISYTFYKNFDFTDLMNYVDAPYLCDNALRTYISNTLKLIHKYAKQLSLEYVFQLNNPDEIISL